MELIILTDEIFQLVPVTKAMLKDMMIVAKVDCFNFCEILRIKLSTYHDYPINQHVMNDGSGDFYGCICK